MTDWHFPTGYDFLSPSQIVEWLNCGECYRLARVERLPRPMNVHAPIGGAIHKAVETFRRRVLADCSTAQGPQAYVLWVDVAAEEFDKRLTVDEDGVELLLDLGDFESVGKAKDEAVRLTKFVLPEIAKVDAKRGLIAAELSLQDWPSPYPFGMRGVVDALYGPDPEHASLGADLKSSRKQAAPGYEAALQLSIYQEFIPVPFMADVVSKAKLPSFQSYSLETPDEGYTHRLVMDVARRIMNGDFPVRPGWTCKWAHGNPTFRAAVSWPEEAA